MPCGTSQAFLEKPGLSLGESRTKSEGDTGRASGTRRNHQGLENKLIDPGPEVGSVAGKIECRERLGGLLRYYHRAA